MKKRIWELDALRGLCVLGMVIVHFVYDLVELYQIISWEYHAPYAFLMKWGGVLFLLISGICVTLGSRSVRRGLIVFGCGLLVSAVTVGMYLLGFEKSIIIYFGVLHCLGTCMLLWPLFRKLPAWALLLIGTVFIALGLWLHGNVFTDSLWLMPLGITPQYFESSDYFPLLPNLGFFLLGAFLGRTVYRKKETLLPMVNEDMAVIRFLRLCGKHSLWIFLLHQPILNAICFVIMLF